MAVQALYRKWRPRAFDEVVGQEHIVRTLRNALTSGRIHHAYLFAGPRGTGKTTTARLLAKAVNCMAPEDQRPCNECTICQAVNEGRLLDLIEIDAASNTGVDDVRELRERVGFRPNEARYKVYVIDEVHMLSNAAFNALLKTLEEPPPHAIFVLATTEPHKVLATVLSRCQRHDFRRIPVSKIVARLDWLAEHEHIPVKREALALIAHQATGSMRDAISLLDQLASYDERGITVAEVRAALGTGSSETVIQVADALIRGDVAQGLGAINTAVDEGADPRQFARQIVEHLRALLLLRLKSGVALAHVPEDLRPQLEAQAAAFSSRALARAVRLFNQAAAEAKGGWQPQLPLEMAFIEATLPAEPESTTPHQPPPPGGTRTSSSPRRPVSPPVRPSRPAPARSASSSPPKSHREVREPASDYGSLVPGDGSLTPETLRNRWAELLDALRPRNLALEALIRSCEPVAVEGDVVVLGFTHNFHRGKVEEEHNKQVVEEVLSSLVGQRYRVRCVLARQERAATVPLARSEPGGTGDKSVSSTEQIIEDPVVRVAIEDLGAQIVRRHG
ncbi:MAG: DNA polymerase III subunit gamma/tau [Chloroflexota bacterium]|nr:DNA polymerase III subunit gamma/tau [Chloroflexota bacterium]